MTFEKNKLYFQEGAVGTEILRRGFPTKLPLWSADVLFKQPELLEGIYTDYIDAGADIIVTNTFRTQRRTLAKVGLELETERINQLAVEITENARVQSNTDRPIYIAGSMTTLEDCYRPDLLPTESEMRNEHREQAELLAGTSIDFFLLETFNTVQEAVIAAEAAYHTGKPIVVSFVANKDGDIFNGDTWDSALSALAQYKPIAVMVNCVPPEIATKALKKLQNLTDLPFGAYGNGAGEADDDQGWQFNSDDQIEAYIAHCKDWIDLGATIIGGCCGTNVAYTKRYSELQRTDFSSRANN